jgi:glucokinase
MSRSAGYLLGLDLGGTRLKALALSPAGEIIARETAPSDLTTWQQTLRSCVASLIDRLGPPVSIGAAAPGLVAADERAISSMPGRLVGLEGLDWTDFLNSPVPVTVLNDARAALLGEVWLGAARGARDVILLTLGTGVGGAVLSDGRLLRGHLGRAGHLGHITLDAGGPPDIVNTPGSLEDAVGNHTIATRSDGRFASTHELVAAAAAGNPAAAEIWQRTLRDLAAGMVSLINVLDPETVILGGGIAEAGEMLFKPLAMELERMEWRPGGQRVRIVHAKLGDWAGAFGAARHAYCKLHPEAQDPIP